MIRRARQNIFDDAARSLPAALILLHNDLDLQTRSDVRAILSIHGFILPH
jgi:hypothetical protein